MLQRAFTRLLIAGALLAAAPGVALAWPDQPIKIIVPNPPGGGFDVVGRILADRLQPLMGQPVIVENRAGAGTRVGTDYAAKAAPDGYTLVIGSLSNLAINPGLYQNLTYDPLKDFTPIGLAVSWSYTLVARNDLPQKTLVDVIAAAKAHPKTITYGGSIGSGQQIAAAITAHLAGAEMTLVPYQGAQAAYIDLMGGRLDLFFDNSATARPLIESGKVRAIAVSSKTRQPYHPDVPTVMETGVAALDMESWFGLFARSSTPPEVLVRLRSEMRKILADPSVIELFEKSGGRPLNLSDEQTSALVASDIRRWTKLVREAGITAD